MSRQRPYGTFEESYIIQMLDRIPEVLDDFVCGMIRSMIEFENLSDRVHDLKKIHLPFIFYDEPLIREYWYGLCRMYGDICTIKENNYILAENIDLCVDHIIDLIKESFPPAWNFENKPILSLYEINFI